jgi:outer membrane receptor protein involved in Fe transport
MLRRLVSLTLALLAVVCVSARAQESASSAIVGVVTDTTQGALPGATVTVTQIGTGAQRVVVTDSEGRFSVPGLRPATYDVKVELAGFTAAEIKAVTLRTGETIRPTLTLAVGAINEAVSVQAEAPLLQTASASVGAVINEKMLEDLPVTGRTLLNITTLAPGVSGRQFQRVTQYGRRDQFVTVEGGRDSSTNYAIDGVYVRSLRFNNMSLNPPIDAVQEVNVLRNSFSTEYGQGQAVVSMVTKSGTNRFTGTASEYFRNDALNARNYFAPTKPEYESNKFGFTAGGPILSNRLFVFGGYEGTRETQGEVQIGSTITDPAWLQGDFSASSTIIRDPLTGLPFAGNRIPANRIVPFASLQLDKIPMNNLPGIANNYRLIRNFTDDTDTITFRLDQVLSSSHNLFERYMWYDSQQVVPAGPFFDNGRPQKGRNLAVGHTWVISPTLVNEVRFGYNYAYHIADNIVEGEDYLSRNWVADIGLKNLQGGITQDYFGRPGANITGFTNNMVVGTGVFQGATENVYSVSNATSKVAGAHNLRFGFQSQFRKFYQSTPVGPRGGFTFNGRATGTANNSTNAFADFLLGYCSTCTGQFGTADSNYTSPTMAPFFDDVWTVNDKLTLQMGVRWEYLAPWVEVDGKEASFDLASGKIAFHEVPDNLPAALLPLVITQDNFYPAGIVEKDLNNFGPRLGAVYNLTDRTVIRAGFGIYYDNLNLNELQFTRLIPPFAGGYDLSPTGTQLVQVMDMFPDLNTISSFPAPFAMNPSNVTAYTKQWNVNVQRTLGRELVLEVAYTGSRIENEHKRFNVNQPREGTEPITQRLPYPAFASRILTSDDTGHGRFEGLSVRIDKRYAQGLFFTGSYQISDNKDNGSGEIEANDTAFAWDHDADWGYSRYHQRHRGTVSFGYELPFGDGQRWLADGGPLAYALGNWQLSGVFRANSGQPYSVSVNALQTLGSFVPSRANFAAGREEDKGEIDTPTVARWFDPAAYTVPAAGFQGRAGRNTLIGPAFRRTDLSLAKRFPVGGQTRFEFRLDVYNLFNDVNFGNPAANISNPNVGTITEAADARSMQLGFRLIW